MRIQFVREHCANSRLTIYRRTVLLDFQTNEIIPFDIIF